jgi:catalase
MKEMVKMVGIDDIPVGSKFQVLKEIYHVSADDIKKADKWWKSLPEEQKVKIYQDIQDAIHGCWNESIEEKEKEM